MVSSIATGLLWAAALGSGLMAGIYFAFSVFIMQAFGKLETAQAVAAMNAINTRILRSGFMPLFFGTTLVSVGLVMLALLQWGEAHSAWMLIAGAGYFVGMFLCTVVFNVPLNESLAGVNENTANRPAVWSRYLRVWTGWNHVRTLSSLLSCGLSIWLLSAA